MKNLLNGIILAALVIATGVKCVAQEDDRALLKQVGHDDQTAVDAIAMYPQETRKNIFEAAKYPELIVRLNSMQKNTDDSFKELLSPYSREEQEKIYNITRYPGLISDLAAPANHPRTKEEINMILGKYPEEIREDALVEANKNFGLLATIDQRNRTYESQLTSMLYSYPVETATAFRNLINQPKILSLLADNMQLTVLIGDVYRKNPQWLMYRADSLNAVLTKNNEQETADWQQSINNDPQAQQEYEQAAQEYAQDNGYQPEESSAPIQPEVINYNVYPYNWWFGYPSWYPYSYWDPYPYWYDWGFYYGPHHHAVFFGCPSHYFMDWYFYHPEHFYRYSHLSNHYYDYYNGHRGSVGSNPICSHVNEWRDRNRDIVNDDWDKNPKNREQMFKDYGKMEIDRADYNKKNPQHPVERADFIKMNQTKYPAIKSTPIAKSSETKSYQKPVQEEMHQQVTKPNIKIPDSYKAPVEELKNNQQPKENPPHEMNAQPRTTYENKHPAISNQVRNAQQNHQNTWQQMPQHSAPQQYSAPAPQQHSAPAPQRQSMGGASGGGGRKK